MPGSCGHPGNDSEHLPPESDGHAARQPRDPVVRLYAVCSAIPRRDSRSRREGGSRRRRDGRVHPQDEDLPRGGSHPADPRRTRRSSRIGAHLLGDGAMLGQAEAAIQKLRREAEDGDPEALTDLAGAHFNLALALEQGRRHDSRRGRRRSASVGEVSVVCLACLSVGFSVSAQTWKWMDYFLSPPGAEATIRFVSLKWPLSGTSEEATANPDGGGDDSRAPRATSHCRVRRSSRCRGGVLVRKSRHHPGWGQQPAVSRASAIHCLTVQRVHMQPGASRGTKRWSTPSAAPPRSRRSSTPSAPGSSDAR